MIWNLANATPFDRQFLRHLHRTTMRPLVEAIWGWDDSVQDGFFETYLAAGNISIIRQNGRPVGAMQIHEQPDHIMLAQIEMDLSAQGTGIGSWAITQAQRTATDAKKPLRLQVLTMNTGAHRLYRRLGFQDTGATKTHILMEWPAPGNSAP